MPLNINIFWQDYNNVTKYVVFTLLLLMTIENVTIKNNVKLLLTILISQQIIILKFVDVHNTKRMH